jgi:hypothetical protein
MLKGWNRKVRMTSAMISAWKTTRIVSATPLSCRFWSVDTLICLSFLGGCARMALLSVGGSCRAAARNWGQQLRWGDDGGARPAATLTAIVVDGSAAL